MTRLPALLAAVLALLAVTSACAPSHRATPPVNPHPVTRTAPDPSLAWLESPGGQAEVTFNDDVGALQSALWVENQVTTAANHLVFEAAARVVRSEARAILASPSLLPERPAAYERELRDFIAVAGLLQPGPGYGTAAQDYAAWWTALRAMDLAGNPVPRQRGQGED